jgi:hypothetical protein
MLMKKMKRSKEGFDFNEDRNADSPKDCESGSPKEVKYSNRKTKN